MPSAPTPVDPAVLRVLLRRLSELEVEAHGVTDAVLGHLPHAGPAMAEATVTDLAAGLADAFSGLADSVAQTRRALAATQQEHVDVDLRVVRELDRVRR
ncbi:MAG: hypothetical protein M3P23_12005 [Actinomycetota bacterium]|nr:hypothetical protein [Actinomycetota bacterium]